MGLGNKRGSGGESAAAGFLAGGLMTGAEALPSHSEQGWRSSWGLPGEGKQQWRSAGCEGDRVGALCWSCCWIHQGRGTRWHLPQLWVFVQAVGPCEPSFYGQAMRHGWDCEEDQVWAGEADFHVRKASSPSAWLASWVALCHPQESRWLPWAATSAKCHQQPQVRCSGSQEGGGGRAPHGSCLPKPGAPDFNLFPPLNKAQNLRITFFSQTSLKLGT